jgi:hypothetical protein
LYGSRTYTPGCPMDEDFLSALTICNCFQEIPGCQCAADRCSFLLISSSLLFGTGFSTSLICRTFGGPYFGQTIAFIFLFNCIFDTRVYCFYDLSLIVSLNTAIPESFAVSVAVTRIFSSSASAGVPEKVLVRTLKLNQDGNGLPSIKVAE